MRTRLAGFTGYDVTSAHCHSEQREESLEETLRGVYPERSRKAQGDMFAASISCGLIEAMKTSREDSSARGISSLRVMNSKQFGQKALDFVGAGENPVFDPAEKQTTNCGGNILSRIDKGFHGGTHAGK